MGLIFKKKEPKEAQKKTVTELVIYLDTKNEEIHLYTMTDGLKESLTCSTTSYTAKAFEKEFFDKIGEILEGYRESHPDVPLQKISVVLPDSVMITDTINVPTIGKRAMSKSINVVLSNIFRNSAELTFNQNQAAQNSQFSTFNVVGTHKKYIARLHRALAEHQVTIGNITYASSAAASAMSALNPKLRNASYVILDVKEDFCRTVFVAKGRAIGFYTLPFGENILRRDRVIAEESLFNHSAAELIVLNAKEKAKSKASALSEKPLEEYAEEGATESSEEPQEKRGKLRAGARKIPPSLIRELPEDEEGFVYENFRIILKWVLGAISSNVPTTALGFPENIYINLPKEFSFLHARLAEEAEECGIGLAPLFAEEENEDIVNNIEVFGGFYYKQYNKANNLSCGPFAEFSKYDGES